MLISEKIILAITVWIVIAIFVTADAELELFFTLVLIGILIIKELSDIFTSKSFKLKINFLIFVFLSTYIVIITQKLINILDI